MKRLLGFLLTFLFINNCFASVLGFRDWKLKQIEEAKISLDVAKIDLRVAKKASPPEAPLAVSAASPKVNAAQKDSLKPKGLRNLSRGDRLSQARVNLEIAQELTVNDYFVLYLSRIQNQDIFLEAAKKMSPEEMAELMRAYQRFMDRSKNGDASISSDPFVGSFQ